MSSLLTVILTGSNTSELRANFFPEIFLDFKENEYSCALLDLIVRNGSDFNKIFRVNCDIISGSYINGTVSRVIHQFAGSVSKVKQQTLVEIPVNLDYLPVKVKHLRSIRISFTDSSDQAVKIQGEISCRINIKRKSLNKHVDLP